jgi:hypothetical protein
MKPNKKVDGIFKKMTTRPLQPSRARIVLEHVFYFAVALWLASLVPVDRYTDNLVRFIEKTVGYQVEVNVEVTALDNAADLEHDEIINVHVTGYNLVEGQTDATPCIGASGKDLCGDGGNFTVACPRKYPLGTVFEIDGFYYTCEDRLAKKYDDRIDINCKLDRECTKAVTGFKEVAVLLK